MLDALMLPLLLVLIAAFLIGLPVVWLKDKNDRALRMEPDEDDDAPPSRPRRF